jgi:type II secretion system (T2SS) protein C
MSRHFRARLLPWLVSCAALVMMGIIVLEVRARPIVDVGTSQPAVFEAHVTQPPPIRRAIPEKAKFAEIAERPLFWSSRRPPFDQAPEIPSAGLNYSLFGVVISTDAPVALLKPEAGGDPVRVQVGEAISGWTVARIESDRVVMRQGGRERELNLNFAAPAPPVPENLMPLDAQAYQQASKQGNANGGAQGNAQGNWQKNEGEASEPGNQATPPPETDDAIDNTTSN